MKKFKILSYAGNFVDEGKLENGIYTTSIPLLRHSGTTIESMATELGWMTDFNGNPFLSKTYFDNLRKCNYVTVELNIINDGDK